MFAVPCIFLVLFDKLFVRSSPIMRFEICDVFAPLGQFAPSAYTLIETSFGNIIRMGENWILNWIQNYTKGCQMM
jgi:hypothetical protein